MMQIVRTEIAQATASSGEAVIRAQFCGEGGECVTVDMANLEAESETAVLDRAKVILIQTATFSMAANDYDAQSNGNLDAVEVTSLQEGADKVYIFEYRDGDESRQVPPSTMPSFEAAREEAVRGALDLLDGLQSGTDNLSGWLVRVRDENGELLCVIDKEKAEAARRTSQRGRHPTHRL
jgi:hypothetical protein